MEELNVLLSNAPNAENFQHLSRMARVIAANAKYLRNIQAKAMKDNNLDVLTNLASISTKPERQITILEELIKHNYDPHIIDQLLNVIHGYLSENDLEKLRTFAYTHKADDTYVIITKYLSEKVLAKLGTPVSSDMSIALTLSLVKNEPYMVYILRSNEFSPVYFNNFFNGVRTIYSVEDIQNFLAIHKYDIYEINLQPLVQQIVYAHKLPVKVTTQAGVRTYTLTNPFNTFNENNENFWKDLFDGDIIKITSNGLNIPIPKAFAL
jgi:hypothetical protein